MSQAPFFVIAFLVSDHAAVKGHIRVITGSVSTLVRSPRWRRWMGLVLSMSGARMLGLAFGAAGSVWAARCLGPENLGISGMVMSLVGQTGLLVSFIHSAVLVREYKRADGPEERGRLLAVQVTTSLGGAVLFAVVAAVLMGFGILPSEYAFAGWFYIPLVLLAAIQPVWVFQAEERQGLQSFLAALQPGLTALFYFLFFKPGMSAGSDLVVVSAVTLVMTAVYWRTLRRWIPADRRLISLEALRDAWPIIRRSAWLYVSALSAYIYTTLQLPMVGWLRSLPELGCYRTAFTLVGAAQAFLTISPTLLYPRFIEWRGRGEEFLWNRQKKLGILLGTAALSCSAIGFAVLPWLHPIIFGEPFRSAGLPAALLMSSKMVVVVHGVFIWGLRTDHTYDKRTSLSMVSMAVLTIGANLFIIPRFGMLGSASVNVLSESLLLVLFLGMSIQRIRRIRRESEEGRAASEERGRASRPLGEPTVDLCVITFQRPNTLSDLLESFARLRIHGGRPRLVVVDNDPGESARPVVEAFARRGLFEVVYDVEPGRGISSARNRALRNVVSPVFAFVDDDETVREDWWVEMKSAMERFGADVIFGPVRERHIGGSPDWMGGKEIQFLLGGGNPPRTGEEVDRGATNNVWVRTEALGDPRSTFDLGFNLTGGGDTDFFRRLHLAGRRMVWCNESVAEESIPPQRLTRSWLCRRAFRDGQGFARVFVVSLGPWKKAFWFLKKGFHLLSGCVLLPFVWVWSEVSGVRLLCKVCATSGQFVVLLGEKTYYEEYGVNRYRGRP